MSTRGTLLTAALSVLERDGVEKFSTRAVCALANVTAPTLYHHFGSADGLLSALLEEGFRQFLERKKRVTRASDPVQALQEGWENYVRLAAERPRLYAAMMARVLQGADIPAARQAHAMLVALVEAIAAAGRLAMEVPEAAQFAWASAHAASVLYVTASLEGPAAMPPPTRTVINGLRDQAMAAICKPGSFRSKFK